jgi:uncharacterized protein (DUF4415 family)
MRRRGEDRTDYARLDAMSAEEIKTNAAEDGDLDWTKAQAGFPPPKRLVSMRLDGDIIDWFKAHGPRYQSHMNAVLRPFMEAHRHPQR